MLLLVLGLFGPGFALVHQNLAHRIQQQRGEVILYPWVEFREEIEEVRPETLALAPEVWKGYRMGGQRSMRQTIARIFYRRQDLRIPRFDSDRLEVDYAIAGPRSFPAWCRQIPGLEDTAVFDTSGRLALVTPGAGRAQPDPARPFAD